MSLNYKYLDLDGDKFLTVYVVGEAPLLASTETHGNFDELLSLAKAGDESVVELFDTGKAISKAFADVVEGRVAVRGGVVYFDDDPQDNSITEAILRFHEQGLPFSPLVKFMENVMANPQAESRDQFHRWLDDRNFPIDDDGYIVAYKGVERDAEGVYRSLHAGHAFVNGVEFKHDYIPNAVGDVVTMPRSEVDFDPNSHCSTGLHAGTHEYATSYARNGALMYVKINPRDVVSVPHDSSSQKVRVCRYEVVGFADTEKAHESAYWSGYEFDEGEDEVAETEFKVGDRVRIQYDPARTELRRSRLEALDALGKTGTVESLEDEYYLYAQVRLDNGTLVDGRVWLSELSRENVRDTRENHKFQQRDAKGHFIKQK